MRPAHPRHRSCTLHAEACVTHGACGYLRARPRCCKRSGLAQWSGEAAHKQPPRPHADSAMSKTRTCTHAGTLHTHRRKPNSTWTLAYCVYGSVRLHFFLRWMGDVALFCEADMWWVCVGCCQACLLTETCCVWGGGKKQLCFQAGHRTLVPCVAFEKFL